MEAVARRRYLQKTALASGLAAWQPTEPKMKQANTGLQHPARSRRIAGRAQDDHILDPYQRQRKMPDGTVCPQCGAVWHRGRWQWSAVIEASHRDTCPACRRIADRMPAGRVTVKGPLAPERSEELVHLARHQEAAERTEHPLNRIINIERDGDDWVITTTDVHLPRRIGGAVSRSFHMRLDEHFDDNNYFVRVTCAPIG
jgi:hypothetical protein